eukprot:317985_1
MAVTLICAYEMGSFPNSSIPQWIVWIWKFFCVISWVSFLWFVYFCGWFSFIKSRKFWYIINFNKYDQSVQKWGLSLYATKRRWRNTEKK